MMLSVSRQAALRRCLTSQASRFLSYKEGGYNDENKFIRDKAVKGAMEDFLGNNTRGSDRKGSAGSLWSNLRKKYEDKESRSGHDGQDNRKGTVVGRDGQDNRKGTVVGRDGQGKRGGTVVGRGAGGRKNTKPSIEVPPGETDPDFDDDGFVNKDKFSSDSYASGGSSSSRGGFRRKGKRRNFDERSKAITHTYDPDNAPIPPAILAVLTPEANIMKRIIRGGRINQKNMDPVDQFLASFYENSIKTPTGTIHDAIDTNDRRRVQLPQPRSMQQLVQQLQPNVKMDENTDHMEIFLEDNDIASLNAAKEQGKALGEDAYRVLCDNLYWSEEEKQYMANMTANLATKILLDSSDFQRQIRELHAETGVRSVANDVFEGIELLFHKEFKKGLTGIEHEKKLKAAMGYVAPDTYVQGETDWDEEAVVDEDDL